MWHWLWTRLILTPWATFQLAQSNYACVCPIFLHKRLKTLLSLKVNAIFKQFLIETFIYSKFIVQIMFHQPEITVEFNRVTQNWYKRGKIATSSKWLVMRWIIIMSNNYHSKHLCSLWPLAVLVNVHYFIVGII